MTSKKVLNTLTLPSSKNLFNLFNSHVNFANRFQYNNLNIKILYQFYGTKIRPPTVNDVQNDANRSKFVLVVDGKEAYASYTLEGDVIKITYVYVPAELREHKVGATLSEGMFKYIASNNLKMVLICGFARHCLDKFPQYKKYLHK